MFNYFGLGATLKLSKQAAQNNIHEFTITNSFWDTL